MSLGPTTTVVGAGPRRPITGGITAIIGGGITAIIGGGITTIGITTIIK